MSDDMKGNPHYSGSRQFSGWARNGTREANENDVTLSAQIFRDYARNQATLALAYEQRTANLLAYYALWNQIEGIQPGGQSDTEIKERLGLSDD